MILGAIGLYVNDMEKMVSFYRDVMGLDINWDGGGFVATELEGQIHHFFCAAEKDMKTLSPRYICGRGELTVTWSYVLMFRATPMLTKNLKESYKLELRQFIHRQQKYLECAFVMLQTQKET